MDMLTHEIDIAGYNPTQAAFSGVTYSATQLELRADVNRDGDTDDANEHIIYTYDATGLQILRNTGDGNEPLADQITAFTVQYLDANGNSTTVSANIRQLRITVTARGRSSTGVMTTGMASTPRIRRPGATSTSPPAPAMARLRAARSRSRSPRSPR
jgi:hypothetical protein